MNQPGLVRELLGLLPGGVNNYALLDNAWQWVVPQLLGISQDIADNNARTMAEDSASRSSAASRSWKSQVREELRTFLNAQTILSKPFLP